MSDEKQPLIDNYSMRGLVTVNEARKDRGLPPLTGADGKADPDGDLTIDAYNSKRCQRDCMPVDVKPAMHTPSERLPFRNLK